MAKFVFVTGGVVSSVGKGIASASLGLLLESRGIKISLAKFDPYINVDPGTMNPYQHGEVFVTEDGAETDLDLGHYERYTSVNLTQRQNITTGSIYNAVISKEREGHYLGATVQVIPHITDEIRARIHGAANGDGVDVAIVEIGGTVGDIESQPFLEAIRQMRLHLGQENVLFIHLTYVPFIKAAREIKTKPTQHSVRALRDIGIQPDILLCRTELPLSDEIKAKIALFCSVEKQAVIEARDVEPEYRVPLMLRDNGLDKIVMNKLGLRGKKQDLSQWERMVNKIANPSKHVRVAIVGKYIEHKDAYKSINEAIVHAGVANDAGVEAQWVDAEELEESGGLKLLSSSQGILVAPGFGHRGIEGKIKAIKYCREKKKPFLGICLGMQCAVIELARHVCKLDGANSTEFDPETPHPVISLLSEQEDIIDVGGTLRRGAYKCKVLPGTLAEKAYRRRIVSERHRHRWEFNNRYRETLEKAGLRVSGVCVDRDLVEIIELKDHPWFVASQFHPEFKSRPLNPSPLFRAFIKAALAAKTK